MSAPNPVSGLGAARIEIAVADRVVVAGIDAHETLQVVEVDAVHRDVGLLIEIDAVGRVTNGNVLLVITRIDDPIAVRSPGVAGPDLLVGIGATAQVDRISGHGIRVGRAQGTCAGAV